MIPPRPAQSVPIGTLVLLALASIFYVWLMVILTGSQGGGAEDSLEQTLETLFLTLFLWGALALLLFAGGIMGDMPRWARILACISHPLSGIGAFTAIDMASHRAEWALLFPALLPLLIAFYAMWARFPRLHTVLPSRITGVAVWGAILILSILPLLMA